MGKGIKNRGVQVHKVKTKYNRKDNMKIVSEEMEQDREMEETYTFRQRRISFNPPKCEDVWMEFEANELPELLDQFLEFVVASGYTYIGSITAHSKLTEKIWTTTEEKE